MYGVEIYYLPRKYVTKNTVIREVIESKFDNAYPLEAYVDTYDGYEGQGTILSKFGIQPLTDLTVIISKERFETYITPLIKNLPNVELATRPKEGDLIYFPLGHRLFEIKFVEHEKPFYQLQKTYVYELRCELFRLEDEIIDTGVADVDNTVNGGVDNLGNTSINDEDSNTYIQGHTQTLQLVGSGVTATAITSVLNHGVRYIDILNRGNGYTSTPTIKISSAPLGGSTAVGIASMIDGLIDCDGIISPKIQAIQIINPGYGYDVTPSIMAIGGGGSGFIATCVLGDGIVGIITVTNGGSGYVNNPTVTISSPSSGETATATAHINTVGIVTMITLSNTGYGYTSVPTITIQSPNVTGIGTYVPNETIVGSISQTTALVRSWNSLTNELIISNISGSFKPGEVITGSESGAFYNLKKYVLDNSIDKYNQNLEIQTESNSIIDFSESNPFGMP
jgi:hypothetical protein